MFERYVEKARRVIFFARYEACQFGSPFIETEHLLLGIVREDKGLVARLGILNGTEAIRKYIEGMTEARPKVATTVDLPMSHAAKRALAMAAEEADRLNHQLIAPAHLLLGLLRDQESLATEILKSHGVGLEQVRQLLLHPPGEVGLLPSRAPAPPPPSPVDSEAGMIQMIMGFWVSRAIYTVAKLGIADILKGGPKSVEGLAEATGSDARSLYRMLRALSSVGVFTELDGQRFATTPLARTLEDRPGTLRYFAMAELGQEHFSAWEEFPYSVRTGGLAFTERFKQEVWEYYATHHEHAEVFNRSMSGLTEWVTQAVLAAYDFSPFQRIVDVGGGQGAFLAAVLGKAPAARGVLFDASPVIAEATRLRDAGLADRSEQVAGDFFEAVPDGGDLYLIKWILHDWHDEQCVTILSHIRSSMAAGGKVLIIEGVLGGAGPDAPFKNFLDLNMMVMTGGCERTEDGYRTLLEKAGFKLSRVVPTASPMSIIEAVAV